MLGKRERNCREEVKRIVCWRRGGGREEGERRTKRETKRRSREVMGKRRDIKYLYEGREV